MPAGRSLFDHPLFRKLARAHWICETALAEKINSF
jgi:hypothetical protein